MTPKLLNSHRLAIGGAHHLHEAGHITADQKDKFQAGSRKVLAQAKTAPQQPMAPQAPPAPFGAMAPQGMIVRPPVGRP